MNIITEEIPTRPVMGARGTFTFDLGSAATEGGGAGSLHVGNGTFALHVGGGGRRLETSVHRMATIGNPHLEAEHAFGFDVSLRWRSARASGEITYFRNDIRDFVFTAPVTAEDFVARETEFAERFPGRGIGEEPAEDSDEGEPLPIIEYLGADSVLQGIEAHADIAVTPTLFIELGVDYVRGTLKDTDEPLPRMPPLRARGGLRYQYNAFQAGGEVTAAATQNRIFSTETPTDNYQLLRLFASYTIGRGKAAHTITARLDNSTNERYRNHLSLIKDLVPEMGRNFKLVYGVTF